MWTRIDWSVFHLGVTNIKSSHDVEKRKKRRFLRFKIAYQSSLTMMHHVKEAESISHLLYFSEGQEKSDSLAKNNFVKATFEKFGAVCDCVRKNAKASKSTCEHCIYNESWLNNNRKGMAFVICPFILLLLLLMFYTIVFNCHHYVDPNGFPYLLRTLMKTFWSGSSE